MQPQKALLFRGGADGERMPLVLGNGRDLDEDVVPRLVIEVGRTVDDQMCHLMCGDQKTCTQVTSVSFLVSPPPPPPPSLL